MSNRTVFILFLVYQIMAISTFGHAFRKIDGDVELKVAGSIISAVAWPLYLSAKFWSEE
jgi:hypothetical protein